MNKIQRWDRFLTVTGIIVVAGFFYILASWDDYEAARDNHRSTFITNDHVTNLHHELVKGE